MQETDDGEPAGFATPSGKIEFYSPTLVEWGWPELATPQPIESQVHRSHFDVEQHEYLLLPTFRLPTLIHTRGANAKWLTELSHTNPLWLHPQDAAREGLETGQLARLTTKIGHFVLPVYVTEGIRPGVVACSHHVGRWRLDGAASGDRTFTGVSLERDGSTWRLRQQRRPGAYESDDADSARRWWTDGGVNQNLAFAVQPDPVSGMHCWHQEVTVRRAEADDQDGDVVVDTERAHELYREWLAETRPADRPDGLRRPLWFGRPVRPAEQAFYRDPSA